MSLSKCLAKAGKNVSTEDRAAIEAKMAEFRAMGSSKRSAEKLAVRAQIEALNAQRYAIAGEIEKSAGGMSQLLLDAPSHDVGSDAAARATAQKIATEQPDLQVTLPGSDERLTVADAMQRIAEEQKQDEEWGHLVRVAAECFLGA